MTEFESLFFSTWDDFPWNGPYTFTHAFALSFNERIRVKNMANQSKMQLSLLDMEKYELLPIAVAHTFMQ